MEIKIAKHGWEQIGGDMDPGAHGATIAKADGRTIEIRRIEPVRDHVGRDAVEVGYPFWTREATFDLSDLNPNNDDVKQALASYGHDTDEQRAAFLRELRPESRAMAIAEALIDYGWADDGPSGWAKDVVPGRVKWWGSKRPAGWRFLADEDVEFRQLLRESR